MLTNGASWLRDQQKMGAWSIPFYNFQILPQQKVRVWKEKMSSGSLVRPVTILGWIFGRRKVELIAHLDDLCIYHSIRETGVEMYWGRYIFAFVRYHFLHHLTANLHLDLKFFSIVANSAYSSGGQPLAKRSIALITNQCTMCSSVQCPCI